jgi:carbon-monoxide dehydrogenase medium subunit
MVLLQPKTLAETIDCLAQYGDEARIVAGATALSILLRQRLLQPSALVSIGGLPGLSAIEVRDGYLRIGALATHRAVELSPLVKRAVPVLAQAFGVVANVRVRTVATVGGVLAEADYASDPPPVILALDGEVETFGPAGGRLIPAREFFVGFYETALAPGEMVTGLRLAIPPDGTYAVYEKYVTRSREDRPCLGAVAAVRLGADGRTCLELRVAVGAVAEVPQRFAEVEALARGSWLDADVIRAIADGYAERVDTLADMRGSAWYRTEMIRVWVRRAIEHALAEAHTNGRNGRVQG